jgi:DNA polymerase sigma
VPDLSSSTHAFGSTLNGFGLGSSDLDLCLFFNSEVVGKRKKMKSELAVLSKIRELFR